MNQQIANSACILPAHDQIQLACDYRGQGEPLLVFIHGWTCRRAYWKPQLASFSERYRVLALDLPGHGDSDSQGRSKWGLLSFARDVESCVRALNGKAVILIGHSMGGAVALEAACLMGDTVVGVVLVDTFAIDYGGLAPEVVQALKGSFNKDFVAAMAGLIEQTSTAATPAVLKDRLALEMATADPAWALPAWDDLLAWNPQAAFTELEIPIHAINGSLIPESARKRCAPFITETVIPGAGHFPHMEDPAGFNRILQNVLNNID